MKNRWEYLGFVGFVALLFFLRNGFNLRAVEIMLVAAGLCLIPLYFGTRDLTRPPSALERAAARAWLWFRRILALVFIALLGTIVWVACVHDPDWGHKLLALGLGIPFIVFAAHIGIYGSGHQRYRFTDDVELHAQHKQRYKWRF